MVTTITTTELATNLADILGRVRDRGEQFVVERDGEPVATLAPIKATPRATIGDFFELVRKLGLPDEAFAGDLEAIQANQPKAEFPEWPS